MSTRQFRDLKDYFRHGADVLVTCKCGKQSVVPIDRVMRLFTRKGYSPDLESAKSRFRCLRCKKAASRLEPYREP